MGKNYLEKQKKFFESHAVEFIREHFGKFVCISDTLQTEFYDDFGSAVVQGWEKYGRGKVMVHQCTWDAMKPKDIGVVWQD